MRDDFPVSVKALLAKRVAHSCSNVGCGQVTSGPQEDPGKAINVGVAAHITAASPDGPRYDATLTAEQRRSPENGIWLCQKCAKLVDNDEIRYTVTALLVWKHQTEATVARALEQRRDPQNTADPIFSKLERLIPNLLEEMRQDITNHPLSREFVLLSRRWTYWPGGHELMYYYEDHPELDNQVRILQNNNLIEDIKFNSIARYVMTEQLADYLAA